MEGELASSWSCSVAKFLADYEHTSLKPYVDMFEKHVAAILRDSRGAKRGRLPYQVCRISLLILLSCQRRVHGLLSITELILLYHASQSIAVDNDPLT